VVLSYRAEVEEVSIGRQRGGSTADERARSSVRVLVVDDAPAFRRVICELLTRRGYQIAGEAWTAAQAIDMTESLEPDAVLLDVHLPDGNGFALAAQLTRAHPYLAVLLTSLDFDNNFYALADMSGARGFVPKSDLARVEFTIFWPASDRA
jgi:DNA-binding NarL/FixJ family response regulator